MSDSVENATPEEATVDVTKSEMVRDAIVFQIKLIVDGLRDFILIPVSLIATGISLFKPGAKSGSEFYEVVAFGRRTEKAINLFGAADRLGREEDHDDPDLDSLVSDVESYVRREAQGERFEAARDRIERALGLRGARAKNGKNAPADADKPDA
ncbi:MAG: hypothetical protein AAF545_09930 [Pseudomonadota bacterium]